ncbi:MAG: GNAT family N-acetyltransferase [Bacteroidota bacterium]
MEHVLDNPAFNALSTGNAKLANGTAQVKYFHKEVSPFIGFDENTDQHFQLLYNQIPHDWPVGFISPTPRDIPQPWKIIFYAPCYQMVYKGDVKAIDERILVELTARHIPQMIALTKLTNPGPFKQRTIEFGHYRGIFDGDNLVAMAGQRMNPLPYAEISAVCTHTDHTGKGYAKQLMQQQINRIISEGNTPFLHVRCDNPHATRIYESMGFEIRREMHFYIIGQ